MQLFKSLLCQILAVLMIVWLNPWLSQLTGDIFFLMLIQGSIAAILSIVIRQPSWWRPMHLFFLPSVWVMLSLPVPDELYLLVFLLMLVVFWGTVKGDVPLFLSSTAVTDALSEIISKQQAANLIELGAGIGSVVAPLARRQPDVQITALENAPLPWLILCWRCRKLANVRVLRSSLWDCDLAAYDLAFAFLSPLVMVRLGDKVRQQMRPGSCLISSSFIVPDWQPDRVMQLADRRKTQLFCYRLKLGNTARDNL